MLRRKGKQKDMDEEQGRGQSRSRQGFWDFPSIRSLFKPSAPVNPTPEIIVTTCSSETIKSAGGEGDAGTGRLTGNPGIASFSAPGSTSKLHHLKSIQEEVLSTKPYKLGGGKDDRDLLDLPSSSDSSASTSRRSSDDSSVAPEWDKKRARRKSESVLSPPPGQHTSPSSTSSGVGPILMNPLMLLENPWNKSSGNTLRLPKTFRKRSSSYSDLSSASIRKRSGSDDPLPDLTPTELRLILMKNLKKTESKTSQDKGKYISQLNEILCLPDEQGLKRSGSKSKSKTKSNSEERILDASSFMSLTKSPKNTPSPTVAAAGLGAISTGLLPAAASVASLIDNRILEMNNLVMSSDNERGRFNDSSVSSTLPRIQSRPRLLSHPEFSVPDTIQSAPIDNVAAAAKRFFIPPYFRRPSQVSTQGFLLSESMVSLTNRALVSFINDENYSGLQHLLDNRRVVVDDKDEAGCTALMIAASKGKANFVRLLLEHGADINAEDADSWSALHFAAKEGHDEIVSDLLDHGAIVDKTEMGGWTPLMWACYKGRTKAAKLLIEKNADVNAYGNFHVTCLAWASGRGHTEIVKELLLHGARVNSGDKYGTTPLIWAARKGFIEIVDALLGYEANVDACGMTSWTPLLVATAGNHVEVVKALLEHKPNINALDKDGCSALTIACKEGFHEIAICLINHGAYININDRGGTSNLIHAAKGGHRSIVESLLKKHADVNFQGKDRKTALYWAVEKSHTSVVRLLLAANPDLELATKDGDTPLMRAVRNRNVEIVSMLLDKRAKVGAADKNGDTILHIAMRARSKAIVELILRNPINSQLLYRPNRSGETPYNIDRAAPKPIMTQIFGSRGLNTQEDGENLLGYNLYSSALADMLSDPTLNTPITVGLFARWGSGKSFLLSKLREEMKSFARQWLNPSFTYDLLILVIILCIAAVLGVVGGLALQSWIVGLAFGGGFTIIIHILLLIIWFSSRRSKYEYSFSNKLSSSLATKMESLRVVSQVIFCHPPGSQSSDQMQAQPINFYFTEQTKISTTTGGENSVVQMLGSLYACIENDYGVMSTRLYRAFRSRPVNATSGWKWRKLCCIPYFVIFLMCFVCTLVWIVVLAMYLTNMAADSLPLLWAEDTLCCHSLLLHRTAEPITLQIIFYTCLLTVGMFLVANMYTIGRIVKAIVLSHRRHLQRTVSKLDAVKAEGFLQALKAEVNLMTNMVKCLDAFTGKQSRLVVIVDGLDSGEQEKVLQVLDAVHILFSDAKAPFIILLAVDPHIIAKGIELNINPVLNESNIGGHDYLRNLVHLPFFLQNAALRKVKHVKMLENSIKRNSRLLDDDGPGLMIARRPSVESGFQLQMDRFDKPPSKKTKKLGMKMSESIASSLGSNLNRVTSNINMPILGVGGPSDLKKMLLGDDYFSDVNPRSMRRLMNIIHITGRLLKSFSIDFNWYHLSAWVNVTEQWPYRLSWMIIYCEQFQKDLDDTMSLKAVYEKVRPFVPTSKEIDANVVLDRDEKKLDVYLGLHKGSLVVSTLYVFLPFTISLDPQLRKDITEQYQPIEQIFKMNPPTAAVAPPAAIPSAAASFMQQFTNPTAQQLRLRNNGRFTMSQPVPTTYPPVFPAVPFWGANGHGLPPFPATHPQIVYPVPPMEPLPVDNALVKEFKHRKLSSMNVEAVCDLLVTLTGIKSSQVTRYQETVRKNNICGRVLMGCDLSDLKMVLQMTFGDWELFKSAVMTLREVEKGTLHLTSPAEENASTTASGATGGKIPRNSSGKDLVRISVTSPTSPVDRSAAKSPSVPAADHSEHGSVTSRKAQQQQQQQQQQQTQPQLRPNVLEKQVTMEEQMICGALELLNEEAKEDALKGEESSTSTLSPINSEPEMYQDHQRDHRKSSKGYLAQDETDVLYVMGTSLNVTAELPDSPSIVRKLEEAETKYSVINETHKTQAVASGSSYATVLRNVSSTSAISDPISIPIPSGSGGVGISSGKKVASSIPLNYSFGGSTMVSSSYPMKSKSFGSKDFKITHVLLHQQHPRSGKDSPVKKSSRKSSAQQQQQQQQQQHFPHIDTSSDASSDESQKPLVMKPLGTDTKQPRKGLSHRPPRPDATSSPQRKRVVQREESMGSRFSKLKSSLFGASNKDGTSLRGTPPTETTPLTSSSSIPSSSRKSKAKPPVRYDLPTEDSEPSLYFREHGHPWKAIRAPTPLPPFGTNEYYNVIKSSNPSPTTSNESELGSSPDNELSSKEEIYMSENPDLPEEPTASSSSRGSNAAGNNHVTIPLVGSSALYIPETNSVPTVSPPTAAMQETTGPSSSSRAVPQVIENPLSSFVPIVLQHQHTYPAAAASSSSNKASKVSRHSLSYLTKPKKLQDRAATSSGEEAIFVPLTRLAKTPMNQSDPGLSSLSSSSLRVESTPLVTLRPESQVGEFINNPTAIAQQQFQELPHELLPLKVDDEEIIMDQEEAQSPTRYSRDSGSSSLMRQSAFDPGSSRETTPQK